MEFKVLIVCLVTCASLDAGTDVSLPTPLKWIRSLPFFFSLLQLHLFKRNSTPQFKSIVLLLCNPTRETRGKTIPQANWKMAVPPATIARNVDEQLLTLELEDGTA